MTERIQVSEVEYVCRWTPATCMDDLCRNSSVGICGNVDPDDDDGWEDTENCMDDDPSAYDEQNGASNG